MPPKRPHPTAAAKPRSRTNEPVGERPELRSQEEEFASFRESNESATAPPVTSRLCVKNLPAYVDEAKLKQVFKAHSDITDLKVVRTPDGRSRKLAFIGFKTAAAATAARDYFDKTFIDTTRIQVEYALPPGSSNLSRPWSKYSSGSSRHEAKPDSKAAAPSDPRSKGQTKGDPKAAGSSNNLFEKLSAEQKALYQSDPKFREFLAVMQSRASKKAAKFWANDDGLLMDESKAGQLASQIDASYEAYQAEKKKKKQKDGKSGKGDSSDEEDDEYFANPSLNDEDTAVQSKSNSRIDEQPDDSPAPDDTEDGRPNSKHAPSDEALSDLEFLKRKAQSSAALFGFDDNEEDGDERGGSPAEEGDADDDAVVTAAASKAKKSSGPAASDSKAQSSDPTDPALAAKQTMNADRAAAIATARSNQEKAQAAKAEADTKKKAVAPASTGDENESADSGRLFVRNLSYGCTEEDLRETFSQFGELAEIHLPTNESKVPMGFGYVAFVFPENAVRAMSELDGTIFQGRLLHILPSAAKKQPKTLEDMGDDEKDRLGYKTKKEMKLKADANKDDSWNTLFIRSDTVVNAISNKLGVKKGEMLNAETDNMAVRLALAETQLISDTKKFLEENGVSMEAFSGSRKSTTSRSDTVILVKNLPFDTTAEEITRLFAKSGTLGRVVLPPSKTVAIVEFLDKYDAQKAFRSLAYSRFKTVPLYLEWAPQGAFSKPADAPTAITVKDKPEPIAEDKEVDAAAVEPGDVKVPTVFVKNLNFDTTEAALEKVFGKVGDIRKVTIATKKNPKFGKSGKDMDKAVLSMGYGFIEYRTRDDALKAIKTLQNVLVDGHQLQVKLSQQSAPGAVQDSSKRKRTEAPSAPDSEAVSSKLVVKNVPFECNAKELRELFAVFGQIKRLRLPKKFDGSHRGYAFIDFVTKQEAKNAKEALQNTHLYGRHLVLDWANEDDSIEDIREKTDRKFRAAQAATAEPTGLGKMTASMDVDGEGDDQEEEAAVPRAKRVKTRKG